MVVDGDGRPVGRGPVPAGLPVMESVDAAKATGERDIRSATITTTVVSIVAPATIPRPWIQATPRSSGRP